MREDCLRLICEPHSLWLSPPLAGVVGIVPALPREGVSLRGELGVGGRVWLVCGWARPPLVFFLLVS